MAVDLFPDRPMTAKEFRDLHRALAEPEVVPLRRFRVTEHSYETHEVLAVDIDQARRMFDHGLGSYISSGVNDVEIEEWSNDQ